MQSLEKIYREHAQTVYRYLLSRTGNPDLSEELTQETFYLAVKGEIKPEIEAGPKKIITVYAEF